MKREKDEEGYSYSYPLNPVSVTGRSIMLLICTMRMCIAAATIGHYIPFRDHNIHCE